VNIIYLKRETDTGVSLNSSVVLPHKTACNTRFAARLARPCCNEQQLLIGSGYWATVLKLRFCCIQVQFINQVLSLVGRITEVQPGSKPSTLCTIFYENYLTMKTSIITLFLFVYFTSCSPTKSHDPKLETPNVDATGVSHGYNLTPLGCLLWAPFTCDETNNGFNVQILKDEKEVSSVGYPYTDLQKQLVFELQKNGTVKYWFKKDYLKSLMDTITLMNGQRSLSHTIFHGEGIKAKLKNIYSSGNWKVNFKDSTLAIDFGNNYFNLLPLQGKYTELGAGKMSFQQTMYFDSLVNGKIETYKKNINTYYEGF
jgi:hypothetical protein